VATFVVVDVLLVLTPGPDWAYVIAVGLRDHMLSAAVAGLVAGYAVLTAIVATGLGALISTTRGALTALTLVGGAYLVWLGSSGLLRQRVEGSDGRASGTTSTVAVALRGAGTSGLNPKGLLLFAAVMPQFVDPAATWPVAIQLTVLGAIHMANCAAGYLGLGSLARNLFGRRPSVAHALTRAAAGAMIILGVLLVLERAIGSG
jgi:threonine/homoserine/homoserine lactone efflux protein